MKEYCKISADSTTENLSNFTTVASAVTKNCALPTTMTSSIKEQHQEHSQTTNGDVSVPNIAVSWKKQRSRRIILAKFKMKKEKI